jgi:cytochrome c oxidase assembly factor CtaG
MFGSGITISERLWAFAFHIILFNVLVNVIVVLFILSLIRIFVKTRITSSNRKPFKLQSPRIVMIE